jgi:hypothetical protein
MSPNGVAVNIILGVLSGLVASIGFWVWTTRLKHPNIMICPALSYHGQGGKCRSTVALINQGKRPAADISIIAELSLTGVSGRTKQALALSLRIREERLPYLLFAQEEQYFLRTSDIKWSYGDLFGSSLPRKLHKSLSHKGKEINLREILQDAESDGLEAVIQVFVIANDAVYGARSYPIQEFRSGDFIDGDFERGKRCRLLGASDTNPNCCQFGRSPWNFVQHQSYYREVRRRGRQREKVRVDAATAEE